MKRRGMLGAFATAGVAGCLRLESGDGTTAGTSTTTRGTATRTTSEPEETAATTEASESTTYEGEATYPLGMSDDGVNQFLFQAHTRALAATSARLRWRKLNHTQGTIDWEKTYDVDSRGALGSWTRQDGGDVAMYRSGELGLWREEIGSDPVFGADGAGFEWRKVSWGVELQPQLSAWDWTTPERVNDERPAVWEVTASEIADASNPPGYNAATLEALDSATLRVNEDGIVRRLDATYTIDEVGDDSYGEVLTYESTFETRLLGEVAVREPSWLDAARSKVPSVRATFARDRQYVAITIESGGRISRDSRIVVFPESGPTDRFLVELEEPLEPGVTAYVWHDESAPTYQNARISRSAPPADASPTPLEGSHWVRAYRDATPYFDDEPVE